VNYKADELLPACEKCGGTGEQENPALQQNQGSYGTRIISATPIRCDACNGKGVIPSEEGKELLKFFRLAKSKGLL
jgi:DnaJ-class molecular chaperone